MKPLREQAILITGATDGIGRLTAQRLAETGARVLLHGRSTDKCDAVRAGIMEATGNEAIETYTADLSDLRQVRDLALTVREDHPGLDILINNAGVGPGQSSRQRRALSADGHELIFAVNYLAPFLLTRLLLPVLRKAAPSRVVNVASAAQRPLDFDDLMFETDYRPMKAYARSKLALIMFSFELAQRLDADRITVNCLHPGSMLDTKMVREAFGSPLGRAEEGAQVEFHVATSPQTASATGKYFDRGQEAQAEAQALADQRESGGAVYRQ